MYNLLTQFILCFVQLIIFCRKWENIETYAAIAISKNPESSTKKYETFSPIYKWKGDHFDKICTLPSYNPQAMDHFNLDSSMFIVVANFQNELGKKLHKRISNIFSITRIQVC